MAITSIIKIIKVNELRKGSKDGREWAMQDAECILMDENGEEQQVGVLMLPKHLRGENAPERGIYSGAFTLQAGMRDRRIEAVLLDLTRYEVRKSPTPTPTPSSGAAAAQKA